MACPVDSPGMLTIRQQMTELLRRGSYRAKEISQELGIREKEVYDHLRHISRTLVHHPGRLTIDPAVCLSCGYIFRKRRRFGKPGRCPRCRDQHIQEPRYRIDEG